MERLHTDVRTKNLFADEVSGAFNPKIYIKSPNWNPSRAKDEIEKKVDNFEKELVTEMKKNMSKPSPNLTKEQTTLLKTLRNNTGLIIVPSDKNLGPCILEREKYITRCLRDHLLDEKTYRRICPDEAVFRNERTRVRLRNIILKAKIMNLLSEEEITYLKRGLKTHHKFPKFYCTIKVHKMKKGSPDSWKTHPVTSTCGSHLSVASKLLDYILQDLLTFIPS